MSKKLFFILISLLMISSFVLGACAQTPAPVEEVEEVEEMEEVEEVGNGRRRGNGRRSYG